MIEYVQPVYRPPSEARSLILQASLGCSHNRCKFCYMYRDKRFKARNWGDLKSDIDEAAALYPETRRIFLADGDAFALSSERLMAVLDYLGESFPGLERVSCYANPENLLVKSVTEIRSLLSRKLSILYYGIESGDPDVLKRVDKGATPAQMAEGCAKAQEAGMRLSVTIILGLGGKEGSLKHARLTAELLNKVNPRFLSALTLMLGPHRETFRKAMGDGFTFNSPVDDVRELGELVAALDVDRCIFRSNHASNYLPLKGTLKKAKARLLEEITLALEDPRKHFRDEWLRGL